MAPPISIRRAWRTALLGAVSGIALASAGPALAAAIIVGTNSGTINGVGSGGTFNGTPFTTRLVGPVRKFLFAGDFIIDDNDEVIATGQRGASFFAANNAIIGTNVTFEFSASGLSAGPGGSSPPFGGGGWRRSWRRCRRLRCRWRWRCRGPLHFFRRRPNGQ